MKKRILLLLVPLLLCGVLSFAQSRTITGTVTGSDDGMPIAGAVITSRDSEGKRVTVISDTKGEYSLSLPSESFEKITFSFMGMESITETVGLRSQINPVLGHSSILIDKVVVTALGVKRNEKSLSYSRQGVDAQGIAENQSGNFVASLAGKVAGVQVTPPSVNNGSARIVIRGTSSLSENSQPVYVIDGMIMENAPGDGGANVTGAGGLDYGNPAADLNPNDIENIEVLKGPNAAALYGSRAAQGVILITTKKGSSFDKVKVTYNSNLQFETISQWPEYQNGWGTGESTYKLGGTTTLADQNNNNIPNLSLLAAGAKRRSWGAPLWGQEVIGFDGKPSYELPQTNNVKDFYNTAHRISNTLTLDGGTKNNNYRLSYTNSFANSVVHDINDNMKNVVNFRILSTVANNVTVDTKATYSHEKVRNRQYMNGSDRNPIYAFSTLPRDLSIDVLKNYKNEEGKETIPIGERGYNPYWNIYENTNEDIRNRLVGSTNVDVKFTPWLKGVLKGGIDTYAWSKTEFNNKGALRDGRGSMANNNTDYVATSLEGLLMFNQTAFENLSIDAILGSSRYVRNTEERRESITSLLIPGLKNISNTGDIPVNSQTIRKKIVNSLFGSLSLGYKGFAFVDLTARNDWSSTLWSQKNGDSNCSYFYPSVGGSLVVSDMLGLHSKTLNFAKIRASYALAGADTEPHRTSQTFPLNGLYKGAPLQSIGSTLNNSNLKPEDTRSFETGVDLRLLEGRLGADITYYDSYSYNLITSIVLPSSSGFTRRYFNSGEIHNWGYEVVLTGMPIKTKSFKWNTTINWSKNNSKVMETLGEGNVLTLRDWNGRLNVVLEKGMPYGVMRGRAWKRDEQGRKLVNSAGSPLYTDGNAYLGNSAPKWSGSIRNQFKYRNFDIGFLVDMRFGGTLFSGTYRRGTIAGVFANTYQGREDWYCSSVILGENTESLTGGIQFADVYFEDGTPSYKFLKPNEATFSNIEEMQCFDASFVKLRELSIGYTMPKNLTKRTPFSAVRVTAVGRNLWIIHQNTPKGIDPESTTTSGNGQGIEYGSIPPVTSLGIDIRLSF